jgi:hypothetical protein
MMNKPKREQVKYGQTSVTLKLCYLKSRLTLRSCPGLRIEHTYEPLEAYPESVHPDSEHA